MRATALSLPQPTATVAIPQPRGPAAPGPAGFTPPPAPRPFGPQTDLAPTERRWLIAGVTGLHLALLWGLLQMGAVRQTLREVAPLMVDFISVQAPPKPTPTPTPTPSPPQPQRQPPLRSTPLPVVVAAPVPQAPPAPTAFVVPEPVPVQAAPIAPAPVAAVAAVTAPAPAAAPALAPAPKPVAASALRYAVLPPVELPLTSRRLGESGTVLLRVVFDTQGRVKQASVHRSSGFARLDEQALAAMRQARITPFVDNGVAIEVSAIAPLAYELD